MQRIISVDDTNYAQPDSQNLRSRDYWPFEDLERVLSSCNRTRVLGAGLCSRSMVCFYGSDHATLHSRTTLPGERNLEVVFLNGMQHDPSNMG